MTQKALLQSAGDGTAVPQGYVGETLYAQQSFTGLGANPAAIMTTGITITPGIWIVNIAGSCDTQVASQLDLFLINSSNAEVQDSLGKNMRIRQGNNSGGATGHLSGYLRVTSNTVYKVAVQPTVAAGATVISYIEAIRIA